MHSKPCNSILHSLHTIRVGGGAESAKELHIINTVGGFIACTSKNNNDIKSNTNDDS